MNQFEIINQTTETIEETQDVFNVIEYALKEEQVEHSIFNIIFVTNEEIHQLNLEYRGIDRPTDVISFALEDVSDIEMEVRVLGDIYISIDKAREQAKEYGHSFKRELCFLAVHGLLHLLGYDHMEKDEEKVMFDRQKEILEHYGIVR